MIKAILIPTKVRCIEGVASTLYPDADFGEVGKVYNVQCIVPNGMYYVLRHMNGDMFANPGDVNYLLNMSRFEVIEVRKCTTTKKNGRAKSIVTHV